ncbi:MAG TPA: hypothetical protein ENH82_00820 [bacterium]|nr:hypothetical protein [bacterium]
MPLNKSKGNMYPWVTHTHTHLGGECPHKCTYCYVDNPRFGRPERYQGELRLIRKELEVNYRQGKTIFIDNCNDLFAEDVIREDLIDVLRHCKKYPDNTYVFQTKNPRRYLDYDVQTNLPPQRILGATIETNRKIECSKAPDPIDRARGMIDLKDKKFITIEPIMDFDFPALLSWINQINPDFVNIGADSKGRGMPEPRAKKVTQLIESMNHLGIEIRGKHNLERLLNPPKGE